MNTQQNKDIVHSFYEAGNAGDVQGFLELLDDGVTWTNIGSTRYSGTFTGKQALTDRLIGPLFGRLKAGIHATVSNVIADGDHVAVQLTGEATTIDGQPYNNTYCHVFRLRDGRIHEVTEYLDTELVTAVFGK
jgi:ketosteroid isomerase-like protein